MPLYDAFTHPCGAALGEIRKLFKAIKENQADVVSQMLEKNPALAHAKNPDERDQSPVLFPAVESKNPAIVRALLEKGADWRLPTRAGWNVLIQACGVATPEIVDLLINIGKAQLNERDRWGSLPIYAAIGNPQMLNHLLERGAKVDLKIALDLNRLDLAERLIKDFPAWVHFRFGTGLTLLHDVARSEAQNVAAMKLLIDNGADVNAVTNWDATPLHVAAFNGRTKTAEYLLSRGAKPNEKDNHDRTPLALAIEEGFERCADVIRRGGGLPD
jgi:ankyrin repeat protein